MSDSQHILSDSQCICEDCPNFQCCQRPFIQVQIPSHINKCLFCQTKYKLTTEYVCPKCNKEQGGLTMYDLLKDGRCDWTTCNHCDYDEFPVTEFKVIKKVNYY